MVGTHAGSVSRAKLWGVPVAGALGVVMGTVMGATLTSPPIQEVWQHVIGADSRLTTSEWPVRELDREWRWTPKAVQFEVMFPEKH